MNDEATMQVGLLLCDDVDESRRADFGTYEKMFADGIGAHDNSLVFNPVQCYQGEIPGSAHDYDAYLLSGSRWGAYEDRQWIHDLQGFVRELWAQRKKTVGICFGHQIIANALGGKAVKSDAGWGLGIQSTQITSPQSWMVGNEPMVPGQFNLVVIHQDQVVTLPPGFKIIAASDFCPMSIVLADDVMLGIQGHPEFNKSFCEYRIHSRKDILPADVFEQSLASLQSMELDSSRVMGWIASFLRS